MSFQREFICTVLGVQIVFFRCFEELQWFASCKEIWRAGTLTAMLQTEVNKSRSSSRYDNIQHRQRFSNQFNTISCRFPVAVVAGQSVYLLLLYCYGCCCTDYGSDCILNVLHRQRFSNQFNTISCRFPVAVVAGQSA